ncbi:MAG: CinA family protein [Intrasporangium sp.]|uniref:CinA family protein n=1 Tax=Intrasporangium sp. TaxID=1925024 RepID=UPI002648ECB1|nr:CinA family protein [Intrasporangium sp.]MDN5794254.1 CinA family protein [Intrasporangium sp.]
MTRELSARVVSRLTEAHQTIACGESLTAGLVSATIADTPGASVVLLGGVVAYAAEVKVDLLGVPIALIAEAGTVDPRVAVAMAEGVRVRLGATWGVSTTGVAGPGPAEGKPTGTVHVAVAGPGGTESRALRLTGDRADIRAATVEHLLRLLVERLDVAVKSSDARTDRRGTVGETARAATTSAARPRTTPTPESPRERHRERHRGG